MQTLIPNMYQESIYTINYEKLLKNKIKCLLFDLDNTCVGYHEKTPTKELKELFKKLTKMGFKIIIFSNATPKRLAPFSILNVVLHPNSRKPFKKNFQKILNQYHYQKKEVCIIGDQLFTDILGGNRIGIKTCLVNPMTTEDLIFTKIFRATEQIVFKKFAKKNILIKGVYYE
jgi:HAD superfamily phosphatase (TIGR01668 family)